MECSGVGMGVAENKGGDFGRPSCVEGDGERDAFRAPISDARLSSSFPSSISRSLAFQSKISEASAALDVFDGEGVATSRKGEGERRRDARVVVLDSASCLKDGTASSSVDATGSARRDP